MNYLFGFQGRIGRMQWWGGQVVIFMAIALFSMSEGINILTATAAQREAYLYLNGTDGALKLLAFCLFIVWTHIALAAKRFHDRDKSGAWSLITFVPVLGGVWLLIECGFFAGTAGTNSYGEEGFSSSAPERRASNDRFGSVGASAGASFRTAHSADFSNRVARITQR